MLGLGDIVKADDRDVPTRDEAAHRQLPRCAHRHNIVVAEERCRRFGQGEGPPERVAPPRPGRRGREHQAFFMGDAGRRQRVLPACRALHLRGDLLIAAEIGDAAMAEPQEMGDGFS